MGKKFRGRWKFWGWPRLVIAFCPNVNPVSSFHPSSGSQVGLGLSTYANPGLDSDSLPSLDVVKKKKHSLLPAYRDSSPCPEHRCKDSRYLQGLCTGWSGCSEETISWGWFLNRTTDPSYKQALGPLLREKHRRCGCINDRPVEVYSQQYLNLAKFFHFFILEEQLIRNIFHWLHT